MSVFRHVLMTRFNLATPGRESAIRNRPGWLEERFDYFERWCLPSVAAQSSRAFDWLIYFDIDTPAPFRARIERARQVVPFTPYFTPMFGPEGWPSSLNASFARTEQLLTTRLDNDDALACDFVERLHAAVAEAPPEPGGERIYNFANGYIRAGDALFRIRHLSNPFFSLLAPWQDLPRSAFSVHHMAVATTPGTVQIGGAPAWMQIVHGGNVSNKVRGRLTTSAPARALFPPETVAGLHDPGRLARAWQNGCLGPLRDTRDRLSALRRRRPR